MSFHPGGSHRSHTMSFTAYCGRVWYMIHMVLVESHGCEVARVTVARAAARGNPYRVAIGGNSADEENARNEWHLVVQRENYSAQSPAIPAGSRFGSCGGGDPRGRRATHHAQSLFPKKRPKRPKTQGFSIYSRQPESTGGHPDLKFTQLSATGAHGLPHTQI